MSDRGCSHLDAVPSVKQPERRACEECVKIDAQWVHLRTCQYCAVTVWVILLVYEMYVGILSQIKNGDDVTQQVDKVLTAARNARIRVFLSRHPSLPKELMGMSQFRMAMAWQRVDSPDQVNPWFLRDAPGFQIVPELSPLSVEGVFDKLTMSAFEGTWLDFALRDYGIIALIVVVVATNIVGDPTVG